MDDITQHQPRFESAELIADESADSITSSDSQPSDGSDTDYFVSARRFLQYQEHYSNLLWNLVEDAIEVYLHFLAEGGNPTEDKDQLVYSYIWKLMDNDLRKDMQKE